MEIIAHRGVHDRYSENTMDAIMEGFQRKEIDGVEFDVRKTKDHEFVIIHNSLINLTSDGSGFVKDKTLRDLRKYNFGTKEHPSKISTLKEILDIAPKNKKIIIELKEEGSFEKKDVQKLLSLLSNYSDKNLYLVSFNRLLIDFIYEKNPSLKVGLCISNVINRKYLNADYSFQSVHHSLYKEVDLKIETFFWTINEVSSLKKLRRRIKEQDLKIATDDPFKLSFHHEQERHFG